MDNILSLNNILSFAAAKRERQPNPQFSYASFGPTPTNCFHDFDRCVKAAMDVQLPYCEGADMYIFEGTTKSIICVITFNGVNYTESGRQFLESRGIVAA